MEPNTLVWYVAYGSNLESSGISHHLAIDQGARVDAHRNLATTNDSPESRWIDIPHSLYFAGQSKTWAGPVAFLSLSPANGHEQARGRAFLLSIGQLQKIVQSENGYHDLSDITYALQIPVGAWAPLPVNFDEHGYKGKYNAILRLPDAPDSRAVVTLTTSRRLEMGAPSESYRSRVCAGLAMDSTPTELRSGLGAADKHFGLNTAFVNQKPAVPMQWSGTIVVGGKSHGLPAVVTLPKRFNGWTGDVVNAQGTVVLKRRRIAIWVHFEEVTNAEFSPGAEQLLGSDVVKIAEHTPLTIQMEEVRVLSRGTVDAQDLPDSDVVHVRSAEAERIGKWALFINDGVAGPVRVAGRTQVPHGEVRVAYAARTLLAHKPIEVLLQPIRPNSVRWKSLMIRPFHRLGEAMIGAPVMALRATEGLVGDEGRPIIRVDAGALDFIGAESGDTVVVTWAHRRVKARALLQTDLTRQRMDHQLEEKTGQQLRRSNQAGRVASRISVPPHLRAWMSPTLRTMLQVPADTVVRVRRSFGYLLLRNSARLALPIAALIISGLAIPDFDVWWWIAASLIIVAVTLMPLRLRQTSGKERKPQARRW